MYSIIPVPNPLIVPGGRFLEFYYWDSYWIIRGLLVTEMYSTARGMLENFLSIIDRYGYMMNGGRVYYASRSHPPLLIPMVADYLAATDDVHFIQEYITTLEQEFQYWQTNHMQSVNGYSLATYGDHSSGPRPESYAEDYESSVHFNTDTEKELHFAELKCGAESGMDFSSRWFIANDGTKNGTLLNINCRSIVPVELNAILYWNAKLLSEFYLKLGDTVKSGQYLTKSEEIFSAVQAVLWHEDIGVWLDWDLINNKRRDYFIPTNLAPLWTNCFEKEDKATLSDKVLAYINRVQVDQYPGGVPNTLEASGEQWDFPNVWPPMQVSRFFI